MQTLPTIPEQTLAMHSQLATLLPFIDSYKVASEHATKVLAAHNAGQDVAKEAKLVRLASRKHRNALETERKELKEEALKYGQAIDGAAKPIREAYEALEADMEAIEKHAEIMEKKRKIELEATRLQQLREVGHTFPEVFKGLGEMDDEQFEYMLERERLAVVAQKAEAERKANEAKLAEEARAKELAEAKAAQAEAEAKAREAQEKLDAERKQREAVEAEAKRKELAAQAEAEAKAREAQAEVERLEKAGDSEKLRAWASQLPAIIANAPAVKGEAEAKALATAVDRLTTIHAYFTKA